MFDKRAVFLILIMVSAFFANQIYNDLCQFISTSGIFQKSSYDYTQCYDDSYFANCIAKSIIYRFYDGIQIHTGHDSKKKRDKQ